MNLFLLYRQPCRVADIRDSVKVVTQPYEQPSHAFTAFAQMFNILQLQV